MATTSIWSIKNNLKQSINYIINPEKTLNKDYGNRESYSYLEGTVVLTFPYEVGTAKNLGHYRTDRVPITDDTRIKYY